MFKKEQIEEMVDLLCSLDENTKIYIGCDSVRFKKNGKRYAKFATVAVVHMNGKNGCRVFRHKSIEPDYDLKSNKPTMRLMNEAQKVCELYVQIAPFVDCYNIEIHLDISTDPKNGSNCAASQAAGYVLGVTGIAPKLKPDAFSSSFAADHYANRFGTSEADFKVLEEAS
jgi:predicted RNase H-related nuclease YkuK (DUF458 family)